MNTIKEARAYYRFKFSFKSALHILRYIFAFVILLSLLLVFANFSLQLPLIWKVPLWGFLFWVFVALPLLQLRLSPYKIVVGPNQIRISTLRGEQQWSREEVETIYLPLSKRLFIGRRRWRLMLKNAAEDRAVNIDNSWEDGNELLACFEDSKLPKREMKSPVDPV